MTIPDIPDFPGTNLQDLNLDWLIDQMKTLDADFRAWPHSPKIENGNWYVWDAVLNDYVDTGVAATGAQGAQGPQGEQGPQGPQGPRGDDAIISGVVSDGADLPNAAEHENELWLVAANLRGELWVSDGTAWAYAGSLQGPQGERGPQGPQGMTGAQGPQGISGPAPMIGDNGNWFVWDANTLAYVDTGVHAQGPAGEVTQEEFDALETDTSDLKSALDYHEAYADATIGTPEVNITDLSGYTAQNGALGSNGNWSNVNSNFQFIVIPIMQKGCKVSITVASNSATSLTYAGVTEFTGAVNGESYHASTFGRKTVSVGGTANYSLTDDTKYLILNIVWGGDAVTVSNFALTKTRTKGEYGDNIAELGIGCTYYGKNLFDKTAAEAGYIDSSGNLHENASYKTTDYIHITNGQPITFSPKVYGLAVFTTEKAVIQAKYTNADTGEVYTYTPTNSGYIRATYYAADENSFMIENGSAATTYVAYEAQQPLNNKVLSINDEVENVKQLVKPALNILVIGDSYSYNEDRYIKYLREHIKFGYFVNLGVSSAHLKDNYADRTTYPYDGRPVSSGTGNNNTFGNQIAKLERLMAGADLDTGETQIYTNASQYPDIILIEGGKNDGIDASTDNYEDEMWEKVSAYCIGASGNTVLMDTYLPVPYNETDRTNFAGAMHYIYGKLHSIFDGAKIFFITPSGINYSNANHMAYMLKSDQMREAARYLCIPTIDWDKEGRLSYVDNVVNGSGTQDDPYTRNAPSEYTVDSLHPNRKGGNLLGAVVCAKLRMYGYIN